MELSSGACGLFERGEIPTIHDAKDGAPENSIAKTWAARRNESIRSKLTRLRHDDKVTPKATANPHQCQWPRGKGATIPRERRPTIFR